MFIAKIKAIYFRENDSQLVGYSKECKRICFMQSTSILNMYKRVVGESEYELYIGNTLDVIKKNIRKDLNGLFGRIIKGYNSEDFFFEISYTEAKDNKFWIPGALVTGDKFNLKTLEKI